MSRTSRLPSGFVCLLKELTFDKGEKDGSVQAFTLITHVLYHITVARGFFSSVKSVLYWGMKERNEKPMGGGVQCLCRKSCHANSLL